MRITSIKHHGQERKLIRKKLIPIRKQTTKKNNLPYRSCMSLRRYSSLIFFLRWSKNTSPFFKSSILSTSVLGENGKSLYSLDLIGHHYRIFLADLGGGFRLVIVRAIVLVWVPVNSTEQITASTVKTCKIRKNVRPLITEIQQRSKFNLQFATFEGHCLGPVLGVMHYK